MATVKTITIDQLKPGMFLVGMDQPWHRTPFLFHKRLIRHQDDINLLRQYAIKIVKIDSSKGLDLEMDSSEKSVHPDPAGQNTKSTHRLRTQEDTLPSRTPNTATPTKPSHEVAPDLLKENSPSTYNAEGNAAAPSNAHKLAEAAHATYTEAASTIERMFEELETGAVPQPATARLVVENVLARVLDDSASMLSLLSLQKMKRFDRTLASHALDVCTLSLIVAQAYGVAEEELEAIGAGALLHDIGYIRLPRNLYRKINDLSEHEHATLQQHPALGQAILQEAKEDREAVIRIVVEHHEYQNGSGFPHKLTGDSLSVLAQLVGLVDIYDGMVSRRGGRPAMLPHDAIRQLFRLGDTGQCSKDLIQAMIGSLGVYPIGSLVLLNTAEHAVVVRMNHAQRIKPVVSVITGPHGGSYLPPIRVDLAAQIAGASVRTITKVLDPLHEHVNVAMFLDGSEEEAA